MVCFFKSIDTFETIGQAIVSEYAVPLASANGSTGSVTVPGELTQDYTRQWLILGDRLLYITAVTPMDNMTTITVGDALTAFNRTIAYVEPTTYYLGEYIKSLAESEYINQSDPYFDMPYLTATNSDTTEFAHITPKDFITSLESVARSAQARGVSIVFSFDADSVTMAISTANATVQAVVMGDGHSQLVSEEYNREQISKVTVVSVLGYPHDYYMTLTGEIVTEAPVNRPPGEWITVTQGADNLLDTAKEAFATSVNSHKIVFFSTLELALFQPLLMRLNGKLYETSITYVGIQSSDRRFLYECGDAATTLTDKVAALTRATAQIESSIPTRLSQMQNDIGAMNYLGANIVTSTTNDTAVNWIGFGTGYSMFSTTGALMNKPANYGMVLSWVNANNVTQLWITVGGDNAVWKRSGDNANSNPGGWYGGGWARLAEASEVSSKSNTLLVESVSVDNISVSAGGYSEQTIPATKSGYTILGVVGYKVANASTSGGYSTRCFPYYVAKTSAGNILFCVRNTYTAAANVKLLADVLYVEN